MFKVLRSFTSHEKAKHFEHWTLNLGLSSIFLRQWVNHEFVDDNVGGAGEDEQH